MTVEETGTLLASGEVAGECDSGDTNESQWILAPDKTFQRQTERKGCGLMCPREGSVCKIRVLPSEITPADVIISRSLKLGNNLARDIQVIVGDHDAELDHMLDKILEHMKAGELSAFKFQLHAVENKKLSDPANIMDFQLGIELISFNEALELWELNPAQLVDGAKHHKDLGVEWFKAGKKLYASRRFVRAMSFLLVIDKEALKQLSQGDTEAAKLNQEYRSLMATLYTNIAAVQLESLQFESAVRNCTKALEIDEKNVKALYRRGTAYARLGELGRAKENLLDALKLAPTDACVRRSIRELSQTFNPS